MAEGVETLVTPQMREALGVWSEPSWSLPIETSDIRRWAIATYYPERPPHLFWDEEYAKTTRWGGIIAPPEFNPFAWMIDTPKERRFWDADNNLPRPSLPPDPNVPGQHGMNGGQEDVYAVPMRPGDTIAETFALTKWDERTGRLGLTLFTYTEIRWENQHGELVRTRTSINIRY